MKIKFDGLNIDNNAIHIVIEKLIPLLKFEPSDLILIDTLSGNSRKNSYPNGDIVYNNTSLYLAKVSNVNINDLKCDSETKRLKFFNPNEVPENLMDADLIKSYISYLNGK